MAEKQGIAAVIGGWSVRHRVIAILGWMALVVLATTVGSLAGQRHMTEDQYATGESARAIQILDDAGLKTPASEMILVTSKGSISDSAARSAVTDLVARLQTTK